MFQVLDEFDPRSCHCMHMEIGWFVVEGLQVWGLVRHKNTADRLFLLCTCRGSRLGLERMKLMALVLPDFYTGGNPCCYLVYSQMRHGVVCVVAVGGGSPLVLVELLGQLVLREGQSVVRQYSQFDERVCDG